MHACVVRVERQMKFSNIVTAPTNTRRNDVWTFRTQPSVARSSRIWAWVGAAVSASYGGAALTGYFKESSIIAGPLARVTLEPHMMKLKRAKLTQQLFSPNTFVQWETRQRSGQLIGCYHSQQQTRLHELHQLSCIVNANKHRSGGADRW